MNANQVIVLASVLLASVWVSNGQPTITSQPTDISVILGANVINQVTAAGTEALTYLWHLNAVALAGATNRSLVLTNIQLAHAGNYSVVVSDSSGSVTSRVATVTLDSTFTKITTGSIVNDCGQSWGCGWGDYDNDGFIDVVVGTTGHSFLYRNNGDGSFTKISNSPIVTAQSNGSEPIWGDYDNDGFLDLFISDPFL